MPEVLKRVGRFDLLEVIGRGGAAVVYLAVQRDLRRNVALKELAPYHSADSSFAERFVEESRLAGAMNHANVVTVHEFFEDGSVPYIAMEYLPHGSLRQYIGRLSTAQIAGVMEGVLAGLSHGEAHGIVHRDLKPENLLVSVDGRVKIADFGVARAYSKAATRAVVTVAGTTIGTPAYMSPEQALGTDLTPATDLYSLGVVAWELLAGRTPFDDGDSPVAVLYRHVHEPIPSVRTVAPDVDEGIAQWLERVLAKRPEDRFQSADDAWIALEDVVLELLGPRWRREARLVVADQPFPTTATLTPAWFDTESGGAPAESPSPEAVSEAPPPEAPAAEDPGAIVAVSQTVSGPVADPAQPPPTLAPVRRRPPSHTTIFRIARRHRDLGDDGGPASSDTVRRRLIVLAIVLAMALAAVGGVVLASNNGHHGPTQAQRRAAAAAAARVSAAKAKAARTATANQQLSTILQALAVSRTRGLGQLQNAKTPSTQASAAVAVQKDYTSARGKVAKLDDQTTLAAPIQTTLQITAADYGRVAAAIRAGNQAKYSQAFEAVKGDENQLQAQIRKL